MNGTQIYDILSNQEHNENVARFTNILREEMNGETLVAGTFLLVRDMESLQGCKDGSDLEKVILDKAQAWEQYGGMPYYEEEWNFDEEGVAESLADDGLPWVAFTDLFLTLEKVAKSYELVVEVSNIIYDTDSPSDADGLPETLTITIPHYIEEEEREEFISNEISNLTGFCHKGFTTDLD
jgi:hypothetical protein